METFEVAVENLIPSKLNSRSFVDQKAIERISEDMMKAGVMHPLLVRAMPPEGQTAGITGVVNFRYEVICGSRRLEAGKLAKLAKLPVHLQRLTDAEALSRIAHENGDREDFHFLDRAEAWRRWKDSGTAPEQIAEEMKVKLSTVYNVIALCNLTPEVKRACFDTNADGDPKLPESVAKELGTVPPQLQGQALKAVLAAGPDGKPRKAREMIELIRTQFRLDLKKSGFDPSDVKLKAEACGGAASCDKCQYRTGNAPQLFEQAKNDNLCTNPPGFRARQDAEWARQVDDGEHKRGPRCLPDSKAKDLFTPGGELRDDGIFVMALDACHQDKSQRAYKTLLGKGYEQHIMLARTPARDVVQLVSTAKLNDVLDEVGIIRRRLAETGKTVAPAADEPEQTADEKREVKEKTERRDKVALLVVTEVMNKLTKRGPDKRTWREAADQLVNGGSLERIWERRDVQEAPSKYLDRLGEAELCTFVIEGQLESELYPTGPKYTELMLRLAKLFNVDVKEHERTVTAAERVQPSVVKADVAEKVKPQATTKKVTPKKKGAKK